MKRITRTVTLPIILTALLAAQTTLTGKWRGETPNGAELVLDLVVKQATLGGTLTRNGQSSTITNGTVSTNNFTFTAALNDQTESFTGELAGEEIRIWLNRQGPAKAVVLKRVKN